jgi:hypothetical protein
MSYFLLVMLVLLIAMIVYAAFADYSARKAGQVLVPVKEGRGRRTTFVRMDRAEAEAQKVAALLAKQEAERAERKREQGILTPGRAFGGLVRKRLQR